MIGCGHVNSGILTVLDNFPSFGIMADAHYAPIKVFSSWHMISYVRKWFLGLQNLWFGTPLTSLWGILTILDNFPSFGIMADTHYAPIKHSGPRFEYRQKFYVFKFNENKDTSLKPYEEQAQKISCKNSYSFLSYDSLKTMKNVNFKGSECHLERSMG